MFRLSKGLLLGVATAQFNVIIAMQQTASSILNYSKNNISMLYRTEKYSVEIWGEDIISATGRYRKLYCIHITTTTSTFRFKLHIGFLVMFQTIHHARG